MEETVTIECKMSGHTALNCQQLANRLRGIVRGDYNIAVSIAGPGGVVDDAVKGLEVATLGIGPNCGFKFTLRGKQQDLLAIQASFMHMLEELCILPSSAS